MLESKDTALVTAFSAFSESVSAVSAGQDW